MKYLLSILFLILFSTTTYAYNFGESISDSGAKDIQDLNINSCTEEVFLDSLTRNFLCNIKMGISYIYHFWKNGYYTIRIYLKYPQKVQIQTKLYKCLSIPFFNSCKYIVKQFSNTEKTTDFEYNGRNIGSYIELKSINNLENQTKSLQVFEGITKTSVTLTARIPEPSYPNISLVFPVRDSFNVTQEFGRTKYSNFHTGIDLSVNKKPVFAIDDGVVEYIGWDNFAGKCDSGGNIVRIRHNNGLFSAYFHLSEFNKELVKNSSVKKGDIIGISGNSGYKECNRLNSHLHFEIRTGANQNLAIDPGIFYINI